MASFEKLLLQKPLLWLLLPKRFFHWVLTAILVVLSCRVASESGRSLLVAVFTASVGAGVIAIAFRIPVRLVNHIMEYPPYVRMAAYALVAYGIVVTSLILPEVRTLRNWWEMFTMTGGAPFATANGLGIYAMVIAALTQNFTWTRHQTEPTHVRGPKLTTAQEASEAAARTASTLSSKSPLHVESMIDWGGVKIPVSRGTEHFCVVGEPGSGKTKTIQMLLKSVAPTIKQGSNRRAVIFDAKRDLIHTLSRFNLSCPVQTLHPFDKRGVAWDIATDVRNPMTAIEIATILIPEKSEREPFFPNAARALLSGVMESLLRSSPGKWTLRDTILALRYPHRTRQLLKSSTDTKYLIRKYVGELRSHRDIASTLENGLRRLAFVAAGWEEAEKKISLDEWVLNGESILVLGWSPEIESTFQELNRAIVFRLSQLILSLEETDRLVGRLPSQTWVVFDELKQAGKLDGLSNIINVGRSKGACVVLGFQDVGVIREIYGEKIADGMVGDCANRLFLRTGEYKTQEFAAASLGRREIDLPRTSVSETSTSGKEQSSSRGTSYSEQRMEQFLVLPSQLGMIARPNPQVGIGGYYKNAGSDNPYFATIPGKVVDELLPPFRADRLTEQNRDFVPRFLKTDALSLKEWTIEDLKRLNLEKYPELLETDEDKVDAKSGDEDWSNILPER